MVATRAYSVSTSRLAIQPYRALTRPGVTADAPSISTKADYTATTIANAQFVAPTSDKVAVFNPACLYTNYNANSAFGSAPVYRNLNHGVSGDASGPLVQSFWTDALQIDFEVQSSATFSLIVDGVPATTLYTPTYSGGNPGRLVSCVFSTAKLRHIVAGINSGTCGFWVGPRDTVAPETGARRLSIASISDSYGAVDGANFDDALDVQVAFALNSFRSCGQPVGGTGYVNRNTSYSTFIERLTFAIASNPDLLLTMGGINDTYDATLIAAVNAYYAAARTGLPNKVLVATGPWAPSSVLAATAKYTGIRDTVKAALTAVGGPWIFIDNLTSSLYTSGGYSRVGTTPWITGDGRALTFTGALVAATSGTLTSAWQGTTGSYTLVFSSGATKTATLTNGSTAVSWSGAVTADAAFGAYSTANGNSTVYIGPDSTHPPNGAPGDYFANRVAADIREGLDNL